MYACIMLCFKRHCVYLHKYAVTLQQHQILPQFQPCFHRWFLQRFAEPTEWFDARTTFARSAAVWSVVGHVVGLGDRHGENLLIDRRRYVYVCVCVWAAFEVYEFASCVISHMMRWWYSIDVHFLVVLFYYSNFVYPRTYTCIHMYMPAPVASVFMLISTVCSIRG